MQGQVIRLEERIRRSARDEAGAGVGRARSATGAALAVALGASASGLAPRERETAPVSWSRDELSGRLTELSGTGNAASLTAAVGLVLQAQMQGELVAWVMPAGGATAAASTFFPPDVADSGVDLASLAVVRVPHGRDAARAAERLVRSGAFGLVIIDLSDLGQAAAVPLPLQGRLVRLAQRYDTALVCITDKPGESPSLGSMVSLRAEALRQLAPAAAEVEPGEPGAAAHGVELPVTSCGELGDGGYFRCKIRVLKDKRRGPGWSHDEVVDGPAGLR
jgi:recombination protein RecA